MRVSDDLVGADRAPVAKRLSFIGSIKWLKSRPFDDHDLAALARVQGAEVLPMVAVSRSGVTAGGLAAHYGPDDLIGAWE